MLNTCPSDDTFQFRFTDLTTIENQCFQKIFQGINSFKNMITGPFRTLDGINEGLDARHSLMTEVISATHLERIVDQPPGSLDWANETRTK